MREHRRAIADGWRVLLAVTLAGGCASDVPSTNVIRSDSAGVAIVESLAPGWQPGEGWSVDTVPRLDLTATGSGAEHEFFRVRDATVLRDGRLVVLNAGTFEARFYAPDGRFLHSVGRQGDGPGDFQRLTGVEQITGDSVMVYDYWLGRATILDVNGKMARTLSVGGDFRFQSLYALGDEGFLALRWSLNAFAQTEGPYRQPYQIVRVSLAGNVGETVATIDGFAGFKINRGDVYADYSPLYRMDGFLAVEGNEAILGSAERVEFLRYSGDGRLRQVVRAPVLDEVLTTGEVERHRSALLARELPAESRRVIEQLPAPDLRPGYSDLELDSEGYAWLARYQTPDELGQPVPWYVFASDGAWLGTLTMPTGFQVLEVGRDYVLGVRVDELGVERVQVLALGRTSG